ncbi:MAG TPA: RNA 3'-terminal phosphate cyclase [Kofleriaceae bacterium]|nr:RNA 3'-terminal phosphate cyclase [Kofleriaceae bacterium]
MTDLIEIDGSHGEGGGQIVRAALGLAIATGRGFRIRNIRGKRAKGGLLRQHLTAAQAARDVCGGELTGDALGSRELTFVPGPPRPGAYRFAINSAGSTLLVVQALLPAMLTTPGAWQLDLEGGTHNPTSPTFEFFVRALAPLLRRLGARVDGTLHRHGFYPAGGGRLTVAVEGQPRLGALALPERGAIVAREIVAIVANLPRTIGEREVATACARLDWPAATGRVEEVRSPGPGNTVSIAIECEHVTELFIGHGAKGVAAERVATDAAREAAAYLGSGAPVGSHLADQLLVPMALGGGGTFDTVALTPHATTQLDLVRWFLGTSIDVRPVDDRGARWRVTVPPRW